MLFPGQPRGPRGRRPFFALVIVAAALALGGVVMGLWNAILPDALHAGRLSYWQGVGLLVLCRVLFGSFGAGRGGAGRGGWAGQGHAKWLAMSDEERQQLQQQWQARRRPWGGPPPPPGAAGQP